MSVCVDYYPNLGNRCGILIGFLTEYLLTDTKAHRSRPVGIRGPVLAPPCSLQTRLPRTAGL